MRKRVNSRNKYVVCTSDKKTTQYVNSDAGLIYLSEKTMMVFDEENANKIIEMGKERGMKLEKLVWLG